MAEVETLGTPLAPRLVGASLLGVLLLAASWVTVRAVERATAPSAPPGSIAPAFVGRTLDGAEVRLADLRGQVVLLDFGATHCVGCVGSTPKLNRLYRRYDREPFVLLWVNQEPDDLETVRRYVRNRPVEYPVLIDEGGTIARAFGARAFPTVVLIDAEGRVRAHHWGAVTEDRLEREVGTVLALRTELATGEE